MTGNIQIAVIRWNDPQKYDTECRGVHFPLDVSDAWVAIYYINGHADLFKTSDIESIRCRIEEE